MLVMQLMLQLLRPRLRHFIHVLLQLLKSLLREGECVSTMDHQLAFCILGDCPSSRTDGDK
uniref:Uncharacterized protein n=1 Tax=Arundo donax TaxID=35708 RepID=A0A0A9B807_ARUDO